MTNPQAKALREFADVLDSLPGLPLLYVVCDSVDGSISVQVAEHAGTDEERIAVADRVAEALGVTCLMQREGSKWRYGTEYGGFPQVFAPQISHAVAKSHQQRAEVTT